MSEPSDLQFNLDIAIDALGEAVVALDRAIAALPDATDADRLEKLLGMTHDAYVAVGEFHHDHFPDDWTDDPETEDEQR